MSNKKNKTVTNELTSQRTADKETQQLALKNLQNSPELDRFRHQAGEWDKFMEGKDYSKPPGFLAFDLASPAHIAKQTERMDDLTGVGAANMGGDDSLALGLAKQHRSAEAAQNAGQSYEQAVGRENAYFRGAAPDYMNSENAKWGNLFGAASGNLMNSTNMWQQQMNKPPGWMQFLGPAIQAASLFV